MAKKDINQWNLIFDRFCAIYPSLAKMTTRFQPFEHPLIVVYLNNGETLVYDDQTKRARFVKDTDNLYKYLVKGL